MSDHITLIGRLVSVRTREFPKGLKGRIVFENNHGLFLDEYDPNFSQEEDTYNEIASVMFGIDGQRFIPWGAITIVDVFRKYPHFDENNYYEIVDRDAEDFYQWVERLSATPWEKP